MATTIANLTAKQDGVLEGMLTTLNVNVPIALVPNATKASDEAPDVRIIARRNGFELGAGWNRISKQTGEEYLSVKMAAPEFGVSSVTVRACVLEIMIVLASSPIDCLPASLSGGVRSAVRNLANSAKPTP